MSRSGQVTIDDTMRGKLARITREVTALRPTREWTGTIAWEGRITDASRDAVTGELRGICLMTAREHTWLALGTWDDTMRDGQMTRHWTTAIELLPA
jgi:hypothetical protein